MEEAVGQHQKVSVPAGTFVSLHLTVAKAKVLLRVLEERLDAPPRGIRANQMLGRCVDLVRDEVLDRLWHCLVEQPPFQVLP